MAAMSRLLRTDCLSFAPPVGVHVHTQPFESVIMSVVLCFCAFRLLNKAYDYLSAAMRSCVWHSAVTEPAAFLTDSSQFLLMEAQRWGIKVHRGFVHKEVTLLLPCGRMRATQEVETINPLGHLLSTERVPRRSNVALATFPFLQTIPASQARRYLSRDTGCSFMDEKADGSVTLVQATIADLDHKWYRGSKIRIVDESGDVDESNAVQAALGTDGSFSANVDPEAVEQLRLCARNMFGAEADAQPVMTCARQYQNQGLVFIGRGEDIHLFLRSEAVRKELGITAWTQRGYATRDTAASCFNLCSRHVEVELRPWDEMVALYCDAEARTFTNVQPLKQFRQDKELGEEISCSTPVNTSSDSIIGCFRNLHFPVCQEIWLQHLQHVAQCIQGQHSLHDLMHGPLHKVQRHFLQYCFLLEHSVQFFLCVLHHMQAGIGCACENLFSTASILFHQLGAAQKAGVCYRCSSCLR